MNVKKYRHQNTKEMLILGISDESTRLGNKWAIIDGIRFQSIREATYYQYLKKEKEKGNVKRFEMQKVFVFKINNTKICEYYADFVVYYKSGQMKVIDVKGVRTNEYLIKRKLMAALYNISIVEK